MNEISYECKRILLDQNIDTASSIDFDINGKVHTISFEYIIDTYMQASDESKLVFLTALKKALLVKKTGINSFFEGMGQLLLMTNLSKKFDI